MKLRTAVYVAPLTAVTLFIMVLLAHSAKPSMACIALAPLLLLATARWAERATDVDWLILRSIGAHLIAVLSATLIMVWMRSSDPGATAHGGVFLMLFFLVPFGAALAAIAGLVSAFCVARLR